MLKKVLTMQVSEPFLLFNEPQPNDGDPAAPRYTEAFEHTPWIHQGYNSILNSHRYVFTSG